MPHSREDARPVVTLSAREKDVLLAFAQGLTDKEIAAELGVSLASVRVYRERLHQKLGTHGMVQPVLVAWKLGLIDLEAVAQEALERSAAVLAAKSNA